MKLERKEIISALRSNKIIYFPVICFMGIKLLHAGGDNILLFKRRRKGEIRM